MYLAELIKQGRLNQCLTAQMLAARLRVGVGTVERWERGGKVQSRHLFALVDAGIIDAKTASLHRPAPIHAMPRHPR
jgi:DNA-binding transcriptional regulator YiaG